MPAGPGNLNLSRAQRKVLADLLLFRDNSSEYTVRSSRQLAESTGLPKSTVRHALGRLNDLALIWTLPGKPATPSSHRILIQNPELLLPGQSGATRPAARAKAVGA